MTIRRFLLATIVCTPLLAACASQSSQYPSLARRDAERMVGSAAPAPADNAVPTPPALPPAGLPAQLSAIAETANAAHARFQSRVDRARSTASAASAAAIASDRWANAQIALAELESARSDTMFALAQLDSMLANGAVEEAESGVPAGLNQIVALRENVAALVAEEDAILSEVASRIG